MSNIARRILNNFKSHNEIRVQQYNALKHSSMIRVFVFTPGVSDRNNLACEPAQKIPLTFLYHVTL
nr:unnamed protein product [Callosobruchus analis]